MWGFFFDGRTTRARATDASVRESHQALRQFALSPTNRLAVEPRDLRDQAHATVPQARGLCTGDPPALALIQHLHQRPKLRVMCAVGMVLTHFTERT